MEDNSFLIKTIAGALILILALNVYRTESTKKQLDHLAVTVDSLTARVGAIEYPNFSDIESDPLSGRDTKKIADLQSKVDAMQKKIDQLSSGQRQAPSNQGGNPATTTPVSGSNKPSGRVSITAKVKIEDRYAENTVSPQVTNGPEGIVVVNITIDPLGNVTSARIGSGTTIEDEEVLDKCKEAALKSDFNMNVSAGSKHPGKITYTFTGK